MNMIKIRQHHLNGVFALGVLALGVVAPITARADFFDDTRRTFQTDIPHFFQDDIPCAFGGQPTSHTRTVCKSDEHRAKQAPAKAGDRAGAASAKAPAGSGR
jgi:hypothetical protein